MQSGRFQLQNAANSIEALTTLHVADCGRQDGSSSHWHVLPGGPDWCFSKMSSIASSNQQHICHLDTKVRSSKYQDRNRLQFSDEYCTYTYINIWIASNISNISTYVDYIHLLSRVLHFGPGPYPVRQGPTPPRWRRQQMHLAWDGYSSYLKFMISTGGTLLLAALIRFYINLYNYS